MSREKVGVATLIVEDGVLEEMIPEDPSDRRQTARSMLPDGQDAPQREALDKGFLRISSQQVNGTTHIGINVDSTPFLARIYYNR